jgi:ferredoxin
MALRIAIDATKCMGSGNCLFWAPGVFDLGDDDVAHVVDPSAAAERQIMQAVEGCPTQAISVVHDAVGTQQPEAPEEPSRHSSPER